MTLNDKIGDTVPLYTLLSTYQMVILLRWWWRWRWMSWYTIYMYYVVKSSQLGANLSESAIQYT